MDFSEEAVADCLVKGLNVTRMDLNAPAAAPHYGALPQMAAFHVVEHVERPANLFAHDLLCNSGSMITVGTNLASVPSSQWAMVR